MRERILEDLKNAMKAQDKKTLSVIRMVKGAMQMEELNKKAELTDDEVIAVIAKQIKTRKESIVEYEKGNRADLIEATQEEIEILNKYMPEQLSEEEINKVIDEIFEEVKPSSIKDMGKVMGLANSKLKGKADMGMVSSTIKEKLNNL
ncbi:MAG: GatB/YqeY domain-containing protein [Lactobacillales bacterium]|nr:GatB/YqeY domain-containing protein [Lactobacillales bacterium]